MLKEATVATPVQIIPSAPTTTAPRTFIATTAGQKPVREFRQSPAANYTPVPDTSLTEIVFWSRSKERALGLRAPNYKEWLENKTSGLLWLSVDSGCGNSATALSLVRHLEIQDDTIACYFFPPFKDNSKGQRRTTFALRAILYQLFVQRLKLCGYTEEAFGAEGSRFVEEVHRDIPVKATAEGGCDDVICVVDVLDECDEDHDPA